MKTKTILAGLVAIGSVALAQIPTSGLVSRWEFTGVLTDAVGGNNGTWIGSASATYTTDRCGVASKALHFNGTTQYVKMNVGYATGNVARSLAFWMKTTNTVSGGPTVVRAMFNDGQYSSGTTGTRWEINHNYSCQGAGVDISMDYITRPSNCLDDGVWHHIAVTQAAGAALSTCIIYLDGVQMTGINCSATPSVGLLNTINQYITIGCVINGGSPDRFFSGDLDDFYLYNRVLSATEVMQAYTDQCTPVPDPLCSNTTTGNPPPSGCCLGNLCGASQNPQIGDYQIPLNNTGFYFTDEADLTDKVNVGYSCNTPGIGKLNSMTARTTNQVTAGGGGGPESIAIYGDNLYGNSKATGVGVMGEANNQENGTSVGVWGNGIGSGDNIGGKFFAGRTRASATRYNIGVSTVAQSSKGNLPSYSYMTAFPSGANIGIYAAGDLTNSPPGGATWGPDWAGWFDGDVNIVGNCFHNLAFQFSDKRLKKNIVPLDNVSEKIKTLNGYTYSFRSDEFKSRGFDTKNHIGLIAQEVKEVFPELISEDSQGFYAVDYQGMIPVLLQAAKEQQQQIDELKAMVSALTGNTTASGSASKTPGNTTPVTLSNKNMVVLNQNVPNPFAENTTISYNLPDVFSTAQIIFSTSDGTVIKTVDLKEKGVGTLTIFANDLTHGMYSYSLIVDGKVIDTKKMIKE